MQVMRPRSARGTIYDVLECNVCAVVLPAYLSDVSSRGGLQRSDRETVDELAREEDIVSGCYHLDCDCNKGNDKSNC